MPWYLWKGSIFRVPLSTLYRENMEGGQNLTHVRFKCDALFLSCCMAQLALGNTLTAYRFQAWASFFIIDNPPGMRQIPVRFYYLRIYDRELCYMPRNFQELQGVR
jgi:hypothetical protein